MWVYSESCGRVYNPAVYERAVCICMESENGGKVYNQAVYE